MSPVFRHGRLRLYLLKLLDEAPRHGYEIIRLLQDRFLGVYAPSPGTIYPRLARLEEEGLVTHDEVEGKKVYRITAKGRDELHGRLDDLAELEETITASVRDIAREVSEDVRETVRSLREELASAARDIQGRPRRTGPGEAAGGAQGSRARGSAPVRDGESAGAPSSGPRTPGDEPRREAADDAREESRAGHEGGRWGGEAHRAREEAWRARWERRAGQTGPGGGHPEGGRPEDWGGWPFSSHRGGWGGWEGWHGGGPRGWADPHLYRDMERLAKRFSRELRNAAWQAHALSEDGVRELRAILDETIERIRDEVFRGKPAPGWVGGEDEGPGAAGSTGTSGGGTGAAGSTGTSGGGAGAAGSPGTPAGGAHGNTATSPEGPASETRAP
jgi:DNA-binding PadR family transcriptional regulator